MMMKIDRKLVEISNDKLEISLRNELAKSIAEYESDLINELEVYKTALYLACNQLNDIYGYNGTSEVVDNFILKAIREIEK